MVETQLAFHDLYCLLIFIQGIFAIATLQERSATALPLGLQDDFLRAFL